MANKHDLEIIITTFNSEFWLKKTLTTLKDYYLDHAKYDVSVTVVDNNSEDNTLSMLKKEYKWVKLIELDENFGFAFANNRAIESSKARYVMLLNSDVEFTNRSRLDVLIDFMDKNPKAGIISPRVEFTDGTIDPACHRGEPTLWASLTYFSNLEYWFPESTLFGRYHQYYKDLKAVHSIDAVSGAALIARKSAVDEIGLLDEQFFMYAEDLDWCKRFRESGYEVIYHPEAVVIHHKNKSGIKSTSQQIAKKTRKHFYNTMLQYYDKHYKNKYPQFMRNLVRYLLVIKKGAL